MVTITYSETRAILHAVLPDSFILFIYFRSIRLMDAAPCSLIDFRDIPVYLIKPGSKTSFRVFQV